jgi:hypothetical protein
LGTCSCGYNRHCGGWRGLSNHIAFKRRCSSVVAQFRKPWMGEEMKMFMSRSFLWSRLVDTGRCCIFQLSDCCPQNRCHCFASYITRQIEIASVILFNKTDLCTARLLVCLASFAVQDPFFQLSGKFVHVQDELSTFLGFLNPSAQQVLSFISCGSHP